MKQRGRRGGVSITARSGVLRLRWTYQGKRQELSLRLPDTPHNRRLATIQAIQLELDLIEGQFDESLNKYRVGQFVQARKPSSSTVSLFKQFSQFKAGKGVSAQALNTKYSALRSNIKRLGRDILTEADARDLIALLRSRQGQLTANQNLFLLKSFGQWLVASNHFAANPFTAISAQTGAAKITQDRTPFSKDELLRFYPAMLLHPTASHYCDFTVSMLLLGLRPSETIGLRWRHILLQRKEITISESLSRGPEGQSSGAGRVRKSTKTERVRILPMSDRLHRLFMARWRPDVQPDDLVFLSPEGQAIDDRNYRNRVWKIVLKAAQIPYRPPYTARHTLISHGLEYGGWTYKQAAYIAGHTSTRTVSRTYSHLLEKPDLPDLGI